MSIDATFSNSAHSVSFLFVFLKIEAFLSSIGEIEVPQTLEQQIVDAGRILM